MHKKNLLTMHAYLDIHTHHATINPLVEAVVCLEPSQFMKGVGADCCSLSVGHHPWRVGPQSGAELATMAQILQDKRVVAVGEIGLDKLCEADFLQQQELFKAQLRMAACVQKPVIVHCVKAWDELLSILSLIDNLPPVVVHGFRGKPQLAHQLVCHGAYLSFGAHFNAQTLADLPVGSFFLETDDDKDADIANLYSQVAELKGVSVEVLKSAIRKLWDDLNAQCNII